MMQGRGSVFSVIMYRRTCPVLSQASEKRRSFMGLTIAEKILSAHLVDGKLTKGSEIGLKIDQTLTQDATGTMAYLEFEAMGIDRVRSPVLKMPTTTALSVRSQKSTAFISRVRAMVFAIRYIWSVLQNRAKR